MLAVLVDGGVLKVQFVVANGPARVVEANPGQSLMDVAVNHDVPGIEGECGGEMACGTCHVYVDDEWQASVGEPSADELEGIECLIVGEVRPSSRLGCQIRVVGDLDGLSVEVPAL
ncbi:2Fe-2S iron-sulfur cluster-binding protein [Nocardioides sp. NPDC051685]|uniref:2Fe-2S iron-sulfur cluster-binding protein n=1 Tax=Nocardioides sp. NPDC051685 TaxID=3364334 RepID=UPI00378C327E